MSEGINEWHHSQSTENTEMKRHGVDFIPLQYRH